MAAILGAALLTAPPPAARAARIDLTKVRAATDRCVWVDLPAPRPAWVSSMAWSADGSQLLMPDAASGEVFVYGRGGALEARLRRPGRGPLEYTQPGDLVAHDGGFLLQDEGLELVRLDAEGEPVGAVDFKTRVFPGGARVRALWNWTAAGEWIVSMSDVREADGGWRSGWFRFTHTGEPRLEAIRELALDDPEQVLCTLSLRYVAAIGERVYILMMAESPYVLEVDGGGQRRRLEAFPEGFARRPSLPAGTGPASTAAFMAAVDRAAMPAGLFAHGDRLYVLTRRPRGEGRTTWEVTGIDPEADQVVSRVRLPTTAAHLVGAPGRERWAFLEKGPVRAMWDQEVRTLLLIPASELWSASGEACLGKTGEPW